MSQLSEALRINELSDRETSFLQELQSAVPEHVLVTDPEQKKSLVASHTFSEEPTPLLVALPENEAQISTIVSYAHAYDIPVYPRGSGTGLGSLSTMVSPGGVLVLTSKLNRIREINSIGHYAVVEPGVINADLNTAVEQYGLFYAPDPASAKLSSIGGNIATNAGGLRCTKYGVTRESLLSLRVVLADGSIIDTSTPTMKNVAGLDLTSLFTGSEGQLGIIVSATVRLHPIPSQSYSVLAFFSTLHEASQGVIAVLSTAVQPSTFELMAVPYEKTYADKFVPLIADAQWMLVVRTDGLGGEEESHLIIDALQTTGATIAAVTPEEEAGFFIMRNTGRYFPRNTAWMAGSDAAVPLDQIPAFLQRIEELAKKYGTEFGALAHVGDGNVHSGFILPKTGSDQGVEPEAVTKAQAELIDYVLSVGGTITGEHGVGLELKDQLVKQVGSRSLEIQQAIKRVFDPQGILNPGKWL